MDSPACFAAVPRVLFPRPPLFVLPSLVALSTLLSLALRLCFVCLAGAMSSSRSRLSLRVARVTRLGGLDDSALGGDEACSRVAEREVIRGGIVDSVVVNAVVM